MPKLCRITIFPIKALDGVELTHARVHANGALENDRRWAIVDAQGRFIHGKQTAAVHAIRANYSEQIDRAWLSAEGRAEEFRLPEDAPEAANWLSEALGLKCRLIENPAGGFPDDGDSPGPTLISTASLEATAKWFPGLSLDEMRRRIRANLEVDANEPFWEDRLADDGRRSPRFTVGPVAYRGRTICARCIVPTRDSQTGHGDPAFPRTFVERRAEALSEWSPSEQFDHYYRLAINTIADWVGPDAVIRVGDEVTASVK
jgi:uncharacterized protein YcbX